MSHNFALVDQTHLVKIEGTELLEPYVARVAEAAEEAETARDIAVAASVTLPNVYATKAAGLAAVAEGETFWSDEDGPPALYRDVAGVATLEHTLGPSDRVFVPTAALTTGSIALGDGLRFLEGTGGTDAEGNTAFGIDAGTQLENVWANTIVGYKSGRILSDKATVNSYAGGLGNVGNTLIGYNVAVVGNGLLDCTLVGTNCGLNANTAMDTCGFGIKCLESMEGASETAAFGHSAGQYIVGVGTIGDIDSVSTTIGVNFSWGHRLTMIGDQAGRFHSDGVTRLVRAKKCCYVGARTTASGEFVIAENAFGYGAAGIGSNTTVIGGAMNTQVRLVGNVCGGNGSMSIPPLAPFHAYNSSSAGLLGDGFRASRPGASTAYSFMAFDTGDTAYFGGVFPGTKANLVLRVSDGASHIDALTIKTDGRAEFVETVKTKADTVAGLPAAATAGAGARGFVTDATATTFASVVAGGGANRVPVYSDGTDWRIG